MGLKLDRVETQLAVLQVWTLTWRAEGCRCLSLLRPRSDYIEWRGDLVFRKDSCLGRCDGDGDLHLNLDWSWRSLWQNSNDRVNRR